MPAPGLSALVFDAYGTLFDVHSVVARCEALFPGQGQRLSQAWRSKQLEYTSNGSPAMLAAVVRHAGLDGTFEAVLSVEEAGIYKPSPRVYQIATRRLELPAAAIGFVSANGWDVAGAGAFGFTTFWVNRAGGPLEALDQPPDFAVGRLDEIPALLG